MIFRAIAVLVTVPMIRPISDFHAFDGCSLTKSVHRLQPSLNLTGISCLSCCSIDQNKTHYWKGIILATGGLSSLFIDTIEGDGEGAKEAREELSMREILFVS